MRGVGCSFGLLTETIRTCPMQKPRLISLPLHKQRHSNALRRVFLFLSRNALFRKRREYHFIRERRTEKHRRTEREQGTGKPRQVLGFDWVVHRLSKEPAEPSREPPLNPNGTHPPTHLLKPRDHLRAREGTGRQRGAPRAHKHPLEPFLALLGHSDAPPYTQPYPAAPGSAQQRPALA